MLSTRSTAILRVLLGAYLVALAFIVFAPADEAVRVTGVVAFTAFVLEAVGVPFDIGYTIVEFTANIALFVPFGVLLTLLAPRLHALRVVATGALLSLTIELTQMLLPTRFPTVSDVVANTAGTALGVAVVLVVARARGIRRSTLGGTAKTAT